MYHYVQITYILRASYVLADILGEASINKNYLRHEKIKMHMSLTMNNVDKLKTMSTFQPHNKAYRNLDTLLTPIFVDNDPRYDGNPGDVVPPVIYEVGNNGIIELHGSLLGHDLSLQDFNTLLLSAASDLDNHGSILYVIQSMYKCHKRGSPQSRVTFIEYILLKIDHNMDRLLQGRENDNDFKNEIKNLKDALLVVIEDGRYIVQ